MSLASDSVLTAPNSEPSDVSSDAGGDDHAGTSAAAGRSSSSAMMSPVPPLSDEDLAPWAALSFEDLIDALPDPPSGRHRSLSVASEAGVGGSGAGRSAEVTPEDEDRFFDLMLRACKGSKFIAEKLQTELFKWMLDVPVEVALRVQERAQVTIETKNPISSGRKLIGRLKNKSPFVLEINKKHLDFGIGADPCPLHRTIRDTISIINRGKTVKFNVIMPSCPPTYTLTTDTVDQVKLGKKASCTISFECKARTTVSVKQIVILELQDGRRHFLTVNLRSELSQFGVPFEDCNLVNDLGCTVPAVLKTMREFLEERDAYSIAGIFRTAGDDDDLMTIREQVNRGTFTGCDDVHIIASLIKVWFRELPTQILNTLPQDTFLTCDSEAECISVFESIQEPDKGLLTWLVHVLATVALREEENNMGARNLSIVVAPNLFQATNTDPLQSLTISQKVVGFVYHILVGKVRELTETSG